MDAHGQRFGDPSAGHPRQARGGFTLIEILMVVIIVGVASAIAVPTFSRSLRGAKMRNSSRTILMMHRHAQSKAVLGQRYMVLLFDARKQTLELVDQGGAGGKNDSFFESVGGGGAGAPPGGVMGVVSSGGGNSANGGNAGGSSGDIAMDSVLTRKLEEGVKILSFKGGRDIDELYFVQYFPNGMCEAFDVRIGTEEGRASRIQVDAVTGAAKVKHE